MSDNKKGSPNDSRVFLIVNGEKRWLKNEEAFWAHGYTFNPDKIVKVGQEEIAVIPDGEDLTPQDGQYYPILKEFATKHQIEI